MTVIGGKNMTAKQIVRHFDMNGRSVKRVNDTIFIALPTEARRAIVGGCQCPYCKAHPDKTPQWDALAIDATGKQTCSWTVHYPDL